MQVFYHFFHIQYHDTQVFDRKNRSFLNMVNKNSTKK